MFPSSLDVFRAPIVSTQEVEARLAPKKFPTSYTPCLTADNISARDVTYVETAYGLASGAGMQKIGELAKLQLSGYPTSLEQDEELLRNSRSRLLDSVPLTVCVSLNVCSLVLHSTVANPGVTLRP